MTSVFHINFLNLCYEWMGVCTCVCAWCVCVFCILEVEKKGKKEGIFSFGYMK